MIAAIETAIIISTHTLTWSVTTAMIGKAADEFISTHTLTWSVTVDNTAVNVQSVISTHTLTWSVTAIMCTVTNAVRFQLTRSRGA